MVTKAANAEVATQERQRSKRRPFGVPTSKLSVNEFIDGFHLRWINDEPGRIAQAQDSGYQFVEPNEVGRVSKEDNKVKELVGVQRDEKTPMYAYLMKIPMEFYLEDRELMNQQLDEIDNAIRGGNLDRQRGDGRYVPEGGISYKTK